MPAAKLPAQIKVVSMIAVLAVLMLNGIFLRLVDDIPAYHRPREGMALSCNVSVVNIKAGSPSLLNRFA